MERILGAEFDVIIAPFEGDSPLGENVQYGERYEAIQKEIRKLTAASSKEISVDWKVIRNQSIELLSQESKDLSVACFLAVALFLEDGYGGARDGLEIVRIFVSDHWGGIFPPREVRRANDLRWLVDRLAPLVENRDVTPPESEYLEPLVEHATALGDQCRDLLREKAPGFGVLISALRARADEAKKLTPPSSEAESATASADGADVGAETSGESAQSDDGAQNSRPPTQQKAAPAPPPSRPAEVSVEEGASASDICVQLENAIKPLRDANPLSPAPYKILRILKWDGVAGPATAGETRIPGPRPNELTPLQTMLQTTNWSGLLNLSENMFKAGHIWLLDLQHYTTLCLENLDPKGALSPAAAAVKEATGEVLKRNPTLVDCLYAGGIPFAADETRAWLTEISAAGDSRVRLARAAESEEETAAFEAGDLDHAIELLRTKQIPEGMEVLQRGIERAPDQRSQFRARLDTARACLDGNQASWARRTLDKLHRMADDPLVFDEWERAWAIELYQLLAICYGRLAKAAKGTEQQNFSVMLGEIQDTLCNLDMQAAAAIQEEL